MGEVQMSVFDLQAAADVARPMLPLRSAAPATKGPSQGARAVVDQATRAPQQRGWAVAPRLSALCPFQRVYVPVPVDPGLEGTISEDDFDPCTEEGSPLSAAGNVLEDVYDPADAPAVHVGPSSNSTGTAAWAGLDARRRKARKEGGRGKSGSARDAARAMKAAKHRVSLPDIV
jgi:hypothetical protein